MPAIGIDLGTTYSCVAVWRKGQVEIIANAQGNRTTPSCVGFTKTERLIGDPAKNQMSINPENTIYDIKRLIGRDYSDPQIQSSMKQWPFRVIDDDEKPKIKVEYLGEKQEFISEEISSMVLENMKKIAEAYLGEKVKDAVITVPAYFNNSQRHATKIAGIIAGLNVIRIINEPTAAALAYGLDRNIKGKKNVLVFDLGGGTTDVSILSIENSQNFIVKSTAGNNYLGGEDFNTKITDYLCNLFQKKHKKKIKNNPIAMKKLRAAANSAKIYLSSSKITTIIVDSLIDGIDFDTELTRAKFEILCSDLFTSAVKLIEKALVDAKMDKMSIDNIVLVGGSTRIPKIQSMIQNFFCGKQLSFTINPDEAVAYGAAVQAAMLTDEGFKSSILKKITLQDITSLSLGIEIRSNTMFKIISRNTKIPIKCTNVLETFIDNQTTVKFPIYEGESSITTNNNYLGEFRLTGIKPLPAGVEKFDVTFDLDADGILNATAVDRSTGKNNNITIKNLSQLSEDDINNLIEKSDKIKNHEEEQKLILTSKLNLEKYIYSVQQSIEDSSFKLNENDKDDIIKICNETLKWLEDNLDLIKHEYDNKLQKVQDMFIKIMSKKDDEKLIIKKQLEDYILMMEETTKNDSFNITPDKKLQIHEICKNTNDWLQQNQFSELDEFKCMLNSVKTMYTMIVTTKEIDRIKSRKEIESYVELLNMALQDDNLSQDKKNQIIKLLDDTKNWLVDHRLDEQDVFVKKLLEIKEQHNSIIITKRKSNITLSNEATKKSKPSNDQEEVHLTGLIYSIKNEIKEEIMQCYDDTSY